MYSCRYCATPGSSTTTDDELSIDSGIGATVVPGSRDERRAATLEAAAPAADRYRTVGTLTGLSLPRAGAAVTLAGRPASINDLTTADASTSSPMTAMGGALWAVAREELA